MAEVKKWIVSEDDNAGRMMFCVQPQVQGVASVWIIVRMEDDNASRKMANRIADFLNAADWSDYDARMPSEEQFRQEYEGNFRSLQKENPGSVPLAPPGMVDVPAARLYKPVDFGLIQGHELESGECEVSGGHSSASYGALPTLSHGSGFTAKPAEGFFEDKTMPRKTDQSLPLAGTLADHLARQAAHVEGHPVAVPDAVIQKMQDDATAAGYPPVSESEAERMRKAIKANFEGEGGAGLGMFENAEIITGESAGALPSNFDGGQGIAPIESLDVESLDAGLTVQNIADLPADWMANDGGIPGVRIAEGEEGEMTDTRTQVSLPSGVRFEKLPLPEGSKLKVSIASGVFVGPRGAIITESDVKELADFFEHDDNRRWIPETEIFGKFGKWPRHYTECILEHLRDSAKTIEGRKGTTDPTGATAWNIWRKIFPE